MMALHQSRKEAWGALGPKGPCSPLPSSVPALSLPAWSHSGCFTVLSFQVAQPLPLTVAPAHTGAAPQEPAWPCWPRELAPDPRPPPTFTAGCQGCMPPLCFADYWFWGIITKGLPATLRDSEPRLVHVYCSDIFSNGRKQLNQSPL